MNYFPIFFIYYFIFQFVYNVLTEKDNRNESKFSLADNKNINKQNVRFENNINKDKLRNLANFLNEEKNYAPCTILEKYLSVKYKIWSQNIKGSKTKIAIFDSGVNKNITNCNIIKTENFSDEPEEDFSDQLICHQDLGIAPHSEILIYKVFNKHRITYTSWLLKAFEKAAEDKVDLINLSFGGINFNDRLIINKIDELVKNGVIIVASAGNDGPAFGTINFPGNLPNVITVGAMNKEVFSILAISSRGPAIYDRDILINKPNTWAPGENIIGLDNKGNYTTKNGSSVSSAVVTGYLSLLISHYYDHRSFFNIGSVILIIKESNINNPNINKDEITSGLFNVDGLFKITNSYLKTSNKNGMNPQILNNIIDFSLDIHSNYTISYENKISQSTVLYATMQPIYFSLIFINPVSNQMNEIKYDFEIQDINKTLSNVEFCVQLVSNVNSDSDLSSNKIFMYENHVGVLQLRLNINNDVKCHFFKEKIDWNILFRDEINKNYYPFKLRFEIIPTPNRFTRVLYSRYHNLFFPFDGYIPKDDLYDTWYNYDWTYESLMTNYYGLTRTLKAADLYVEELNESIDCVDLSNYSVLLIIDPERRLSASEIEILKREYENNHLSLFIITDWNVPEIKSNFEVIDYDTLKIDRPIKCGSEINSFNDFLSNYGIKIGLDTISREFNLNNRMLKIKSGSSISKFPSNSFLFGNYLKNDLTMINSKLENKVYRAVLGLSDQLNEKLNSGRMAIFTDTYCLDDYQLRLNSDNNCFWLISSIIKFLIHGNYANNDLQLKNKNILKLDYDDSTVRKKSTNSVYIEDEVVNKLKNCLFKNLSKTLFEKEDYLEFDTFKYKKSQKTTDVIPNLISKYSFDDKKQLREESESNLAKMIEDFLYVIVPILAIIFIIFLVVHCKQVKVRRTRIIINLSHLKQTTPIERDNLNDSTESSSIIINSLV